MDKLPKGLPPVGWTLMAPEQATELLLGNTRNRKLNQKRLDKMIGDWEAGLFDWRAGVTIKVGADGTLLDGQKTLAMICHTGEAMPVVLMTDVPDEAWLAMDNVQPRSLGQNLQREAVENASIAAGVARALWQGANGIVIGGRESASQPVLGRLYAARRREIDQRAKDAKRINNDLNFGSPSVLGAIMVMCDEVDLQASTDFFERVERGNREKGSPNPVAQFLRHIDSTNRGIANSRRGPDTVAHGAYLIKAFNQHRRKNTTVITWNASRDPYPSLD